MNNKFCVKFVTDRQTDMALFCPFLLQFLVFLLQNHISYLVNSILTLRSLNNEN